MFDFCMIASIVNNNNHNNVYTQTILSEIREIT